MIDSDAMDQGGEDRADAVRDALRQAEAARTERDALRLAVRRAALAAEARLQDLQSRHDALLRRVEVAEADAEAWRTRYQSLRGRLEAFLVRSGLLRVARLVPRSVRQSVRRTLLGRPG